MPERASPRSFPVQALCPTCCRLREHSAVVNFELILAWKSQKKSPQTTVTCGLPRKTSFWVLSQMQLCRSWQTRWHFALFSCSGQREATDQTSLLPLFPLQNKRSSVHLQVLLVLLNQHLQVQAPMRPDASSKTNKTKNKFQNLPRPFTLPHPAPHPATPPPRLWVPSSVLRHSFLQKSWKVNLCSDVLFLLERSCFLFFV